MATKNNSHRIALNEKKRKQLNWINVQVTEDFNVEILCPKEGEFSYPVVIPGTYLGMNPKGCYLVTYQIGIDNSQVVSATPTKIQREENLSRNYWIDRTKRRFVLRTKANDGKIYDFSIIILLNKKLNSSFSKKVGKSLQNLVNRLFSTDANVFEMFIKNEGLESFNRSVKKLINSRFFIVEKITIIN